MLIDARHREETRVAVVKGNRIEEFDFESAERKQLKGNIYLAKVTRVEPSLQAAFIDYGGNRHGFLAFSEIHPDYYQIPKEDRDALLREEAEHAAEEAALRAEQDDDDDNGDDAGGDYGDGDHDEGDHDDDYAEDAVADRGDDGGDEEGDEGADEGDADDHGRPAPRRSGNKGDDQVEALRQRRLNLRRRYKIQDVIHRRQVLLVQVVKEERGNKGAALTTYLSLAGRYCVLMPNTSHGGGISRKISNGADRKRLKSIMADLALPPSMGCIVRTAGLQRTRTEIKRDFDYLARLWDEIREKTLGSSAPAVVYGDSDLMKRAIRDIYNKDIDEVIVEGDDGYRQAKDFMKLLMPSHAKKVKHYSDPVPLFQRAGVEDQLSAMYHPVVQLKSGGYLVINPTEALVSIDINSGRSTREHSIEQTATATNLEAAQEIARQLRLRDMAGLVVIDFIDMDNNSNVRKVEKAMKEALKNDRARIQVGRISSFGLMEMSRQRLRTGVLEASTRACPHCEGTGLVRTASSAGLSALRLIEDEAARGRGSILTLRASQEAAFYVLNRKRADIAEIEDRYGVHVEIMSDGEPEGSRMSVEASGPPPAYAPKFAPIAVEEDDDDDYVEEDEAEIEEEREERPERGRGREARDDAGEGEDGGRRRRRRRSRRGRGRDREGGEAPIGEQAEGEDGELYEATGAAADALDEEDAPPREDRDEGEAGERKRRGRRGRRGGRRNGATGPAEDAEAIEDALPEALPLSADAAPEVAADWQPEAEEPAKRTRRRPRARAIDEVEAGAEETGAAPIADPDAPKPRRGRRKSEPAEEVAAEVPTAPAPDAEPAPEPAPEAPKPRGRRKKADVPVVDVEDAPAIPLASAPDTPVDDAAGPTAGGEADPADAAPRRRGWWQSTFGS
ncbi:MAG: Rne/Rng family ribonuclease [Pseudomonadota bacterium]